MGAVCPMSFGAAAPDPRQALQAPVYQYNSDLQRVEMKVFRWQQDGVWVCESCGATWNVMAPIRRRGLGIPIGSNVSPNKSQTEAS